jgi:hypothetical protein
MNADARTAAEHRAATLSARTDTAPQDRRSALGTGRCGTTATLTLRDGETGTGALTFEGYASVYESPYAMWDAFGPYVEIVSRRAGAASLARPDLDVPLVLSHDTMRRIARTTTGTLALTETAQGLHVLAPNLDPEDADVAYIAPKLRAGLIDEMSFAFRIIKGAWSPDFTEYRIDEYDIHRGDVAIVGYGANPATVGALRHDGAPGQRSRAAVVLALAGR